MSSNKLLERPRERGGRAVLELNSVLGGAELTSSRAAHRIVSHLHGAVS
jgi:hypothetical protein